MGTSRIEQTIEEIYEFIESCKMSPLSSTKVVVPKDELYDLLDELKMRVPDEIKRYKKVIANREAILADAQKKAEEIIEDAQRQTESIINDSEIVQQAYFQANQIVSQATDEANRMMAKAGQESEQIRVSALSYTNDLLADAEHALGSAYENAREKYEGLLSTLKYGLDTIENNRAELGLDSGQKAYEEDLQASYQEESPKTDAFEGDYNFDEDTFLEDIK